MIAPPSKAPFADIGARLLKLRTSRNLTQSKFASKLGICVRAYGNYESGSAIPTSQALLGAHRSFGVSADHILFGLPNPVDLNTLNSFSGDLDHYMRRHCITLSSKECANLVMFCIIMFQSHPQLSVETLFDLAGLPDVKSNSNGREI